MMKKNVLLLKKITKTKVGNEILHQFFLEIASGEIVNLIGLSSSGKEEICHLIFGEEQRDSGEIWFLGKKYASERELPIEKVNGIFYIGNDNRVIPHFSVAENIYVGKVNYFQFSVPKNKMEQQVKRLFREFDIDIAPDTKAEELNKFEICVLRLMRAYVKRAKLIVIDDILDAHSFWKLQQIIDMLNRFKEEGISVLWVNSYPDAITKLADKVVVIRSGRNGITFYHEEYDEERLLDSLTGMGSALRRSERKSYRTDRIAFETVDITNDYFKNISFHCFKGEILGIYDIQNQFSQELEKVLLGQEDFEGQIRVEDGSGETDYDYRSMRNRIGVVNGNGDNYHNLLFPELSVRENIEMALYKKASLGQWFISGRMLKYFEHLGTDICDKYRLENSGGRISRMEAIKIIYNRWKLVTPKVMFCFQPFFRLDAISRKQLENILVEFCQKGTGIVLVSADFSILTTICDRILTVENDRIEKEAERSEFLEQF